jgi:hypothetical protein
MTARVTNEERKKQEKRGRGTTAEQQQRFVGVAEVSKIVTSVDDKRARVGLWGWLATPPTFHCVKTFSLALVT